MTNIINTNAVLPGQGETAFLIVGHLQRAHGIKGEIAMQVITDFPERLQKGKKVWVGDAHIQHVIKSIRWKQDLMLLGFEGIDDRSGIDVLVNQDVFIQTSALPKLPDGRYYFHQLIGLSIFEKENFIGKVTEILETGANDVFVISLPGGKELLLPDIKSVILNVDLEEQKIQVAIPEGLK
jgi:16S rRNA processing protein RimM